MCLHMWDRGKGAYTCPVSHWHPGKEKVTVSFYVLATEYPPWFMLEGRSACCHETQSTAPRLTLLCHGVDLYNPPAPHSTHTHTHIHTHTHTHTHTCMHTCAQESMHVHVHTQTTCTHTFSNTHSCALMYTHTHHIHMHAHTLKPPHIPGEPPLTPPRRDLQEACLLFKESLSELGGVLGSTPSGCWHPDPWPSFPGQKPGC